MSDNEYFNQLMTARKAITDYMGEKFGAGEIPCPICKTGKLRFIRHENKHIHAACSNKCVCWME